MNESIKVARNITGLADPASLVRINRLAQDISATIRGKLEAINPLSSIRDRLGKALIENVELRGSLKPDTGERYVSLASLFKV